MDEWLRALVNRAYWIGVHETDMDVGTALLAAARPGFFQFQYEEAWRLAQIGAANVAGIRELEDLYQARIGAGQRTTAQQRRIAVGTEPLAAFATVGSPYQGELVVRVLVTFQLPTGEQDHMMFTYNADWSNTPAQLRDRATEEATPLAKKYGSVIASAEIIGPLL